MPSPFSSESNTKSLAHFDDTRESGIHPIFPAPGRVICGQRGDFAMAYVVVQEIGHHVRSVLGFLGQTNETRARVSDSGSNAISVRTGLQADCLAGILSGGHPGPRGSVAVRHHLAG